MTTPSAVSSFLMEDVVEPITVLIHLNHASQPANQRPIWTTWVSFVKQFFTLLIVKFNFSSMPTSTRCWAVQKIFQRILLRQKWSEVQISRLYRLWRQWKQIRNNVRVQSDLRGLCSKFQTRIKLKNLPQFKNIFFCILSRPLILFQNNLFC